VGQSDFHRVGAMIIRQSMAHPQKKDQ
jgi:hypothetical protein